MRLLTLTALLAAILPVFSATAATVTVFDTSLAAINGAFGAGTASTTTVAGMGTTTTVTGPAGGANRASGAFASDQWVQRNVGGNGSAGITTDYARSGNGSAYFTGTGASGTYKSDLEILFGTSIAASSITGFGFDWLRSSGSSVTSANLHPVIRLLVSGTVGNAPVGGYLVFERDYNGGGAAPVNTWTSESLSFTSGNIWATGSLPNAFAEYGRQLDDWDSLVSNLTVRGLSIGVGSGWNGGGFVGAVDNVSLMTARSSTTWNFEVAASSNVPEPTSLALVGVALAGLGVLGRRRRAG